MPRAFDLERRALLYTTVALALVAAIHAAFVAWLSGGARLPTPEPRHGIYFSPLLVLAAPWMARLLARPTTPDRHALLAGLALPLVLAVPWGLLAGALDEGRLGRRLQLGLRYAVESTLLAAPLVVPLCAAAMWAAWRLLRGPCRTPAA